MITDRQWFHAKHGNTPTFTIPKPSRRKDYGSDYPQPSFLDRHGARLGVFLTGLSSIIVIMALIGTAIMLFPAACSHEIDRQIAVVESQINGGER